MTDLFNRLKPWVNTFSEEIRLKYKHGDEVHVGGQITSIFDLYKYSSDKDPVIQVDIDDGVGESVLLIPIKIYTVCKEKYGIKEQDVVLARGKVLDPSNFLSDKNKGHIKPTIMCWNIKPLNK